MNFSGKEWLIQRPDFNWGNIRNIIHWTEYAFNYKHLNPTFLPFKLLLNPSFVAIDSKKVRVFSTSLFARREGPAWNSRAKHASLTRQRRVEPYPTSSLTLAPDLSFDERMFVFLTSANMQPSLCFPKLGKNATVICLDRLTKRILHVVDVIWPQLPIHFSFSVFFLFKSNRISKIRWTCAVKISCRSHKNNRNFCESHFR